MRAARFHEYGEPSVLRIEDAPEPHATAGTIRIRTLAASVNPIDYVLRSGLFKDVMPLNLPAIPGRDAAGIVDEVGDGVTGVVEGDLVFGLGGATDATAEYSVLTAWALVPPTWNADQAAAAGLAANTGIRGLDALGDLAGQTILIEGAAGAVGGAAAAVAVSRGARVIGTARLEHHELLTELGVIPTTYGDGLIERVRALAPEGVDVALDTAASGSLPDLVTITGDASRVATVADGARAGELGVQAVNAKNDFVTLEEAAALGAAGGYLPRVARVVSLDQIVEAHTLAEQRGSGKIVVAIQSA